MTRQLLVAIAISATMLGSFLWMVDFADECHTKQGAMVMEFPIGLACVARL